MFARTESHKTAKARRKRSEAYEAALASFEADHELAKFWGGRIR